jgi:hypothetical protein
MGEKWPIKFSLQSQLPRKLKWFFTCRKAATWNWRLYFPSKGRHAEDFFARKIRWLRPGLNPWTWVPEASMRTTRPPKLLVLHYKLPNFVFVRVLMGLWPQALFGAQKQWFTSVPVFVTICCVIICLWKYFLYVKWHVCLAVAQGHKGRNAGLVYSSVSRLEWFERTDLKSPGIWPMRIKQNTQTVDIKKEDW